MTENDAEIPITDVTSESDKDVEGGAHTWSACPGGLVWAAMAGFLAVVLAGLASFVWSGRTIGPAMTHVPDYIKADAPFRPWRYILVHHSATKSGSMDAFSRYHRISKGWPRIGYHFVIGCGNGSGDGQIETTPTWRGQHEGIHTGLRLYNAKGIAVCLVGNFEEDGPTGAQMRSLAVLCRELAKRFDVPAKSILRHGDVQVTKCPGKNFPWNEFKEALNMESAKGL